MKRTFEVLCGHCGRFITGLLTPLPEPTAENTAKTNFGILEGQSGIHLFGIQRHPPAPERLRAKLVAIGLKETGCDNCLEVTGGAEISFKIAKQKVAHLEKEVERLRKEGRTNAICCDEFEQALEEGRIFRKCGRWTMNIEPDKAPPGDFEKKFADAALQVIEEKFGKTKGAEFMMAWCPFCKQRF